MVPEVQLQGSFSLPQCSSRLGLFPQILPQQIRPLQQCLRFTVLRHRDGGEREPQKDAQLQFAIVCSPHRPNGGEKMLGGLGMAILRGKGPPDVVAGPLLLQEIARLPGPFDPEPARLLCLGIAPQPV